MNDQTDDALDANWWKRAPRQIKNLVIMLVACVATLASVMAAWPMVEPVVPGLRYWVREHVEETEARIRKNFNPTTIGMYDIQIGIARSRRSQINDQIFRAELDVPKSESGDEVVKRRAQIERLKEEKMELEAEIKRLLTAREKS